MQYNFTHHHSAINHHPLQYDLLTLIYTNLQHSTLIPHPYILTFLTNRCAATEVEVKILTYCLLKYWTNAKKYKRAGTKMWRMPSCRKYKCKKGRTYL